jgi:F-type H+-transporting ATPase subunit b
MHFDWSTLALQTVNFAVLAWLLHRFLYRPVLVMIDARKAAIRKLFDEAGAADADAKARLAAIAAERAGMAAEREGTLRSALAQAQEAAELLRAQARNDAAAMLEATRKALAGERERALAELRTHAAELGAEFAQRLLAGFPPGFAEQAWLARVEASLEALGPEQREALARQLGDGSVLAVLTASPLSPAMMQSWRASLQRSLGPDIAIAFDAEPGLIAGAELRFPTACLHFSWRSALEVLRSEVADHAQPR